MKKIASLLIIALLMSVSSIAAFEKINTYSGHFTDIKESAWYAKNVKTAYELGFMTGKTETEFDPDGNVTVVEGIAMASRLHALYNRTEIKTKPIENFEYRIDFDDPDYFVDLSKRNSRNDYGASCYRSFGEIRDGAIVIQADGTNDRGSYDPGFFIEGLDLDAKRFNKITFRMKIEELPNLDPQKPRHETVEIYFKTSASPSITGDKCVYANISKIEDKSEWFEVSVDAGSVAYWTDFIRGLRFDPTNNNGIFYVDYIVFSKSEKGDNSKWYDMYVDYALDNGIIEKHDYTSKDYNRGITRGELCSLFASALPEEYFNPINDIEKIPDVDMYSNEADVYLALYNAGIILGSDEIGTFNPRSNIRRSETAAIINRVALPENRVKGIIDFNGAESACEADKEFNNSSDLDKIQIKDAEGVISNGALVLCAIQRADGRYDAKASFKNLNINAHDYSKIRVRMKAENVDTELNTKYDLYFMNDGDDNFTEQKSFHGDYLKTAYVDSFGWYVFDIDLRLNPIWDGKITGVRFDPSNSSGTFTIDYIRFVSDDGYYTLTSHRDLIDAGYSATRLLQDEGFERGFYVGRVKNTASSLENGLFQDYCETDETPLWIISPHWARFDLVDDRDTTTDKYTIKDTAGANTVTYNPDEKSLTMRVNATKIYEGKPHIAEEYEWWPHLLVAQNSSISPVDVERNSAAADRMFVEIDIRCLDFKDSPVREGAVQPSFMTYFYLRTPKAPGQLIWFGIDFLNGTSANKGTGAGWSPDSAAHQYMYKIRQAVFYGGIENSFNPENGVIVTGEEWKSVRFDVTPHIEQAVTWANRDNVFGVPVTLEDMYIEGVNIGYETWGNFDYTMEFKNFNMVSYTKIK